MTPPSTLFSYPAVENGHLATCETVVSTMDAARELLGSGRMDLVGVRAEYQSAGRGRQGGAWLAPPGTCLLVTYILRSSGLPDFARNLPFAAGVAVAEVVEELTDISVKLKWPNDVLASGKKLAGILVETVTHFEGGSSLPLSTGQFDGSVFQGQTTYRPETSKAGARSRPPKRAGSELIYLVGVGLNVNVDRFPEELAQHATSLEIETGLLFDVGEIEEAVRRNLFRIACHQWSEILGDWRARDDTAGRLYRTPDGAEGVAVSVTDQGILRLRCGNSIIETLAATSIR
jgi:biotin-(acetyl-CoA carboxylase) ligase